MALEKIRPRVVDATGNYRFNDVTLTGNVSSPTANIANITGVNNLVANSTVITLSGSLTTTSNISAGNIKTDNLLYANGVAWSIGQGSTASGANTQVQFNDASTFGASSNFTFNKDTNTLTVTKISGNGAALTSLTGGNIVGAVPNATYATTAGTATTATTAGTVTTNAQPNITSVGTLTTLDITGNLTAGNANLGNLTISNFFSGSGNGLSNIQGSNVSGAVSYATTANGVAGSNVTGAVTYASTANAVAGANVLGQVANALVAGTVYTAEQPNITSVGTLTTLIVGNATANSTFGNGTITVTGNLTAGNANLGNAVSANYFIGNGSLLTGITALSAGYIANGNSNVNIPSANGNVNITSAGNTTMVITGTGANITGTANITGNVSAPYFIGNGAFLTGVDISPANISNGNSNVNIPTANGNVNISVANTANVLVITSTGANLNGTLNVSGDATVGNIVTGTGAGGNITGANIISANTLIALGNANLGNTVTANYFTGNFYGTANLATYATTANSVAGANVSGQVANALVAGTVYTNAQPNITSVGTLTSLAVTGDTTLTGNLTVSGTFEYANVTSFRVKDPIIEQGGDTTGAALTTNDGYDRGQLLHYHNGTSAVDAFMGWDNSNAEFAFGSNVSISSEVATFNSFGNVRAGYFIGNGALLTGVTTASTNISNGNSNVNISSGNGNISVSVTGVSNTVVFSNVGVNVAGYVTATGNLTAGNANLGNAVVANYFIGDGSLITGVDLLSVGGADTANRIANGTSTIDTPIIDGNITVTIGGTSNTVVFTNAGVNFSGYVNATSISTGGGSGNLSGANWIIANYFSGAGNNLSNIQGSNVTGAVAYATTANSVAGANVSGQVANALVADTVTTAAQGNITSLGTLTGLTSNGTVNFTNASNVALGAVANVHITGGSLGQYLSTDGSGTLSWVSVSSSSTLANGNSSVDILTANGNVNITAVGNTTMVVTGTGANITGTLNATGNANVGNIGASRGVFTTVVGSLTTAAQPNITSVGTLTSLSVTGNVTAGNLIGSLANGNSNVSIPSANGNVNISAVGNANVLVVTGTGANITGTANVSGNLSAGNIIAGSGTGGNITGANVISANTFTASGNVTAGNIKSDNLLYANGSPYVFTVAASGSNTQVQFNDSSVFAGSANFTFNKTSNTLSVTNIVANGSGLTSLTGGNVTGAVAYATTANSVAGANVSGQVANSLVAGTVYTNAQPNITSVGTLTSLAVTGNTSSGNFIGTYANGNSNISIPSANGNINFSAEGNANIVAITGTGVNVTGTFDSTGNIHTSASANIDGLLTVSSSDGNNPNKGIAFPLPGGALADANASIRYYHYGNFYQTVFEIGVGNNLINASGQDSINLVASGGVGVKTLTPSVEFEVTGRAKVSGNTEIGGLLTGTGNVAFSGANVTLGAVANLHITGGTSGYVLQTDGSGTLSWVAQSGGGGASSIVNGNSNVNIASANSNVNISVANNPNIVVVTSTGANINGYANITGNVSLGGANVSIGDVSNLHIGGGSNTYVLSTDGAGNLSWTAATSSSLSIAVDNFTGNGTAVNYTLTNTPANINCTIVSIAGLFQPRTVYSLSGNVVTFSSAPKNTAPIEITTFIPASGGSGGGGGGSGITAQDLLSPFLLMGA